MRWIEGEFNLNSLNYCTNKEDAQDIGKLIYKTAIKNHKNSVCGKICTFVQYPNKISYLGQE